MENKLRRHIEELFKDVRPTKKTVELEEEMIQNLIEKYQDLINEGKSEEAAFKIAVAGIGDVSELIDSLEEGELVMVSEKYEAQRQKSALLTAIAIMGYIISFVPLLVISEVGGPEIIGLVLLFTIVAASTGLLVYNNMTKPNYYKEDATMVEEFKEWKYGKDQQKSLRAAISGALWSIITVIYFVISFTTHQWHITWVIWVLGGAIEAFISILFTLKK